MSDDKESDKKLRDVLKRIRGFNPFINGARVASIFVLSTLLIKKVTNHNISSYSELLENAVLVFGISLANDYFVFEYELLNTKNQKKINIIPDYGG